jgi:hypothetical protein
MSTDYVEEEEMYLVKFDSEEGFEGLNIHYH